MRNRVLNGLRHSKYGSCIMQRPWKSLVLATSVTCLLVGEVHAQDRVSASPARSDDAATVRQSLQSVLAIASSGDKNAPDQIERQLQSLLVKTDNDPRLHYVHALVLLKNFRHADATRAMQAAADHRLYYFPVHHFLIYEQIRQKQYEAATDSLAELGERIGDPGQLWTSEDDRLEAAHWLGRMIAFLQGPCGNGAAAKMMTHAEPAIRTQVGPVYETEINRGIDELHAEHREMQMLLLAAVDTAGQKKAAELKETGKKQQELDSYKKQLATSERTQEAIAKEQLRDLDSLLGALEKKYDSLQLAQEQLTTTIASIRIEIAQLPSLVPAMSSSSGRGVTGFRGGGSRGLTESELETALVVRNLELQSYVLELQKNAANQTELLRRAEGLLSVRQGIVSSAESSEAKSQESQRRLGRWERRFATSRKNVHQITDRRSVAIRSRISLISSYDSLSIPDEIADLERSVMGDAVNP